MSKRDDAPRGFLVILEVFARSLRQQLPVTIRFWRPAREVWTEARKCDFLKSLKQQTQL